MPENVSIDSDYGLLARIEAKSELVAAVGEFLESALSEAEDEHGSTTWFWYQIAETTFGIFDTFTDEDARATHQDGGIAERLLANADELGAAEAQIDGIEVPATKHT